MKKWIPVFIVLFSLTAQLAHADDDDLACVVDQESTGFTLGNGSEALYMLASTGAFGMSCESIKSVVGDIQSVKTVITSVTFLLLLRPELAKLLAKASIQLEKNPYILAVTVVGVGGTAYAYLKLEAASVACDQQERKQEMDEEIQKILENKLKLEMPQPATVRCEDGLT